jgi:hypothetical protein
VPKVRFNRWQSIAKDREKTCDGDERGGGDGDEACATNGRANAGYLNAAEFIRPPPGERSDARLQRHIGVEGRIERRRMRRVGARSGAQCRCTTAAYGKLRQHDVVAKTAVTILEA